jgi:dTMP kinase
LVGVEPAPREDDLEPAELDPAGAVAESLRLLRQEQHERERRRHERVDRAEPGVETKERPGLYTRVFGSEAFFRLWLAQAITSLGDWLGFLAIVVLATRIGAGSGGAAVGVVMAARIIPGFFFAAGAGVLIDRMDRKQVMVVTMIARAAVVALLPFVDTVLGLVFASFILEIGTLFFTPAKEATVPNLVPADHLATANSLSLAAAYGTFPIASLLFLLLAKVAEWLGQFEVLDNLRVSQESVAFYVEVACFLAAAVIISRLSISREHMRRTEDEERIDLGQVFTEIKEGWSFIFLNPVVRSVNIGLATGLVGGGMVVPLGAVFATEVLDAGPAGFGLFITALGVGVAAGVVVVSVTQRRIPKERVFALSVLLAGVSLVAAASMSTFALSALCCSLMGLFAGAVYVLGFTLLHENVEDELRGRVFAGLYTLVRLCILLAFAAGPFLAGALDSLSESVVGGDVEIGGVVVQVPGVRLALWLAGTIMIIAGVLAAISLRSVHRVTSTTDGAVDGAC